jgi:acyl-CoA synthetase (AMP-forming)/AMP-acid ligase II
MHLTDLLDTAARQWPQKPALIEGSTVLSYAGLIERVDSLAAQLRAQSLAPGKRVGLHFPDGPGYVALTYALWRVGAVVVPVPQECTEEEIAGITRSMQLDAMITLKPGAGSVALQPEGMFQWLSPAEAGVPPAGLDLAFIRFTSGTTSARKGVALSHETVAWSGASRCPTIFSSPSCST